MISGILSLSIFSGGKGDPLWRGGEGGKREVVFLLRERESARGLPKPNIAKCGAQDKSIVIAGDYSKALSKIREKVQVFLLDPPYKDGLYEKCLAQIEELDLLDEDGVIIAEPRRERFCTGTGGKSCKGQREKIRQNYGEHIQTRKRCAGRRFRCL